jgi:broad specificity phosphatase PhoE
MNLKKVYFVKHAESEDDHNEIHMRSDTPLSEEGREQASLLAGRFSHTPFDLLIASPLERSKETAEFIGLASSKNIRFEDIFNEIKEPTVLEESTQEDSNFDSIRGVLQEKWHLPAWHYSDEENFTDARMRGKRALKMLEEIQSESVVVVTHGHFLTMLFLVMALGKMVTADEFITFDTFSHTDNTGISLCELTDKGWKMRTWNDITHITEMIH